MSIKAVWATFALLASPSIALACTPATYELSTEERLGRAQAWAALAASPSLATQIRGATDISVVRVAGSDPAPATDIPPPYRAGLKFYKAAGLEPVRYRLAVERVLKGSPPAEFVFWVPKSLIPGDIERVWTVALNDDFDDSSKPRSQMAFWHEGGLALGLVSGGPGDCSNQVALNPGHSYLVLRDAEGVVVVAEPLSADDPLPDFVAAILADPNVAYPWRPTVLEFLALPGVVARVRITNCDKEQGEITEVLRGRPNDDTSDVAQGETIDLYGLVPGFLIAACHIGSDYLVTGWPHSVRLHPVVAGHVRFEDRWMQLRLSGEKTIPLDTVRALLARA